MTDPAGTLFRRAVALHRPLQVVGTINAMAALMARQAGHMERPEEEGTWWTYTCNEKERERLSEGFGFPMNSL